MSLSLDVEYGILAKQNLGNSYVNAINLSSNLEKIVSAINDISSAVKTNIVVRSVNDLLPLNETNDINLNTLRPNKSETDVYKEILSSDYLFMENSSEVSFKYTMIGKKEISDGSNQIQSILVDDNKIFAGSNGNGIFYSEDNGETFEQATGIKGQVVTVIKKFFGKYFAGTKESIYQSTDGKNWTIFTVKVGKDVYLFTLLVNDLLQVKYGNRKILIAATNDGVYAATNNLSIKLLINGRSFALTNYDKDNVYLTANGNVYVVSIEKINNYLIAAEEKTGINETDFEADLQKYEFGSNVYDMLIKDETLYAAVSYTIEEDSHARISVTYNGIKKAHLSNLSLQSFTGIHGISLQINYLKTNGYGIYTQIKNNSYPTFWFTTDGLNFNSYQTTLTGENIFEFDFIDNFTLVAGANGGIIKFKQAADYVRDKLITERDLSANNSLLCTYINSQDSKTYTSANNYTDEEINKLKNTLENTINNGIEGIENVTLTSYELISTFNLNYISLGKDTYGNSANKQNNNVAIGQKVAVTANDSIGLGQNITANGSYNIAVGNNLSTSNANAIAIGYNLSSFPNNGNHSIAIGYNTAALCADSIAIGRMISAETTSTTKIGAAFGNTITGDNAETIALELSAKIKDDENATSESKAYITVNRFTKNTGIWSETKKEISLKGHTHVISDIIGLSNEFTSHNNKINYISSYVSAIPGNVENTSNDLISLSNQTKTISTSLCSEITSLCSNISSTIDNQKVITSSDLSAYTKDGELSSDTVKFPTAAAITLWADNRYLLLVSFNDPTAVITLLLSMLVSSDYNVYCNSLEGVGDDLNDGSEEHPVKTITKAIQLANKKRFISGSLIYINLYGEFNVRNEAAVYIAKKDSNGNYYYDISDITNEFKNAYALVIHHPDMKAPSYMHIRTYKYKPKDSNDEYYEYAKITADLRNTVMFQIAIFAYCDTIFENIQFNGCVPYSVYDPSLLLNNSSISATFDEDIKNRPNIIEPKYSKNDNAYSKERINSSFLLGSFSPYVKCHHCSCYNFMTAFVNLDLVYDCYFLNGYMCTETTKGNSTEIQGLSCYNINCVSHIFLTGIEYIANASEYLIQRFRNLRKYLITGNEGFTILFNLYFSYIGYYDKNTLRLLDTIDNGKQVNRITDNYNIYKYCSSYSYVHNDELCSVEGLHTKVDYVDFIYTFMYGLPPAGILLSDRYANYRNKYGGNLAFYCGDYATSSIIYTDLSNAVKGSTEKRLICYFPFLELLFNIIRENDLTVTSLYDGTEYSTIYNAYKISDITSIQSDNSLSIDYTKFTISAYKDLFDSIY